ncbi:MAG: hypothetical protein ACYC5J_06865 [Chloroflexota bacterium]
MTGSPLVEQSAAASSLSLRSTARNWHVAEAPARVFSGLQQRRLLAILLFLAIFAFNFTRPTDIDFWWHLETGELIATTGVVPATDPYSYTAPGRPWTTHEWLWELALYWVYRWGGYALAALLSAAAVTLTYIILYSLLRRLGANEFVAAALVLWATLVAIPGIGVRPREFTQLFLAFFLNRLFLYREGRIRHLWSLPPLMALWVNLHGQFLLGLGLLGLFLIGGVVDWLSARAKDPRHLLVVGLATAAAACLNPAGLAMLRYPIDYYLQGDNPSFTLVTEFQSPDFHQPLYLAFAAGLLLLALVPRPLGRRTIVEALLVIVFTIQALVSARQIAAFALAIPPLLALRLADRFALARELPPPSHSRPLVGLNWLLLLAVAVMGIVYASQPAVSERLQLGREPIASSFPVAGARFIEEAGLPDPVLNEQSWGGYLIHQWYPRRRVFIDGRIDMYGPAIARDYLHVVSLRPDWRDVLDRYGVRTILIRKDSALSASLLADGGWRRAFQGEMEDVFVRGGSR